VSVVKGRQPVLGLGRADFELKDQGVVQAISVVLGDRLPMDLTLILTASAADRDRELLRALSSAGATSRLLLPGDRLHLVWVDDGVRDAVVTSAYEAEADPIVRQWLTRTVQRRGVALTDGVFFALAWPVDPDRRHLVIAFTDGFDTASTIDQERLPVLAAHCDAEFHAVLWTTPASGGSGGGVREIPPNVHRREWEQSFHLIDDVVRQTGGTLQFADRAHEALASIVTAFRSSYVLRYTRHGVAAGGWHDLSVRITRSGSYTVRARKGYEAV
jgi:hypothetical protein